jgi:hypothetical protein
MLLRSCDCYKPLALSNSDQGFRPIVINPEEKVDKAFAELDFCSFSLEYRQMEQQ